jgi:hypothetical protein
VQGAQRVRRSLLLVQLSRVLRGLLGLALVACSRRHDPPEPKGGRASQPALPVFEGSVAQDKPLAPLRTPQNPHMAPNGRCAMHVDAASSDTYDVAGPHGFRTSVQTRAFGLVGGECPTINFDRSGRLVAMCVGMRRPSLHLLEATSLRELARFELPKRAESFLRLRTAMQDTSGGAYFYLDERDRAVVGTSEGTIEIVALRDSAAPHFEVDASLDVRSALALRDPPDRLTAVLPDWEGRYWFTGRFGVVGVVTRGAAPRALLLQGEEIENSFSVGPDGVYIVSDHALYRFGLDQAGQPRVVWRAGYDRGTRRKVGQINQGSGTTPTLLGERYVAIADNAEPRLQVVVFRRDAPVEVCRVPVFAPGASATENSLVGYGRSLIVENNAGYDLFITMRGGRVSSPGVARVEIREDESGCDVVWTSAEVSETVVHKLSTRTGLVYLYTKRPHPSGNLEAFYLTALDFDSGATVFRVLAGTGIGFDNNWAELALGPDGAAYVGVLNGLVRISDGPQR